MNTWQDTAKIWALTLVFSSLLFVGYAYFIAMPISRMSKDMAKAICVAFHLDCDRTKLSGPHPEENQ